MPPVWKVRGRELELAKPLIMGILNLTPDSFSDGGRLFSSQEDVLQHVSTMIAEGADIIDIGGESTRPGATPVSATDELNRVLPVIRHLADCHPETVLSIDTVKSVVARAALDAGAHIVNDVSGLRLDPDIADICASSGAGLVLMHSRGGVSDMASYAHARYDDVVGDALRELGVQLDVALDRGVDKAAIALDPGIGFSKKSEHSLAVLAALGRLVEWGYPVLVGVSRKRFIGEITGTREPTGRLSGTLGANVTALALGARIFRVHDVRPAREALDVAWRILGQTR
jgi:dihydropteroate synthase